MLWPERGDDGVKNVLESRQLGDALVTRGFEHLLGRALRQNAALFEGDHALTQGENLLAAVRDVEDRNAVGRIPDPQVGDDLGSRRAVERCKRLIQQQQTRLRHQRTRQRRPLAFAAGDGVGLAAGEMLDAK